MPTDKLSKACDACKTKKIKCDRQQPVCGYCQRHSLECKFGYNRRPGLKPGYGKQITDRLTELETAVEGYRLAIAQVAELGRKVQELERKLETVLKTQLPVSPSVILPGPLLPELLVLERIVLVYLDELYVLFPVLDPLRSVSILLSDVSNPPAVLYGVIALSLHWLAVLSPEETTKLFSHCRATVLRRAKDALELSAVQAVALLAARLLGDAAVDLRRTLAVTNEACKRVGLYALSNSVTTYEETQLVWTIYQLNCYNLFIHQIEIETIPRIPLPIPVEQHLSGDTAPGSNPRFLDTLENTVLYGSNSFYIEMVHFLATIYTAVQNATLIDDVRNGFVEVDTQVGRWLDLLPLGYTDFLTGSELIFKDSLTIHDVLLHGSYHVYQIVKEITFLYNEPADVAVQRANSSAQRIIDFCKQSAVIFNSDQLHQHGIMYVICLWVAGRVNLMSSVHLKEELHGDLDYVVGKLYEIGNRWLQASRYADRLAQMQQQYANSRAEVLSAFQRRYESSQAGMDSFLYHAGEETTGPVGIFDVIKSEE